MRNCGIFEALRGQPASTFVSLEWMVLFVLSGATNGSDGLWSGGPQALRARTIPETLAEILVERRVTDPL